MKALLSILMLGLIACNPYKHATIPVKMNYAVTVLSDSVNYGHILCRDYEIQSDTLILYDAGYWAKKRIQHKTTTIRIIGTLRILVVDI